MLCVFVCLCVCVHTHPVPAVEIDASSEALGEACDGVLVRKRAATTGAIVLSHASRTLAPQSLDTGAVYQTAEPA